MSRYPQTGDDSAEIRQLDSLLRGEISATETYRMAIDSVTDDTGHSDDLQLLRQLQEDHGRAAQSLRARIRELGGEASDASGPWGAWAKLTQATANLFGDTASLKSLKEGEEHGLKDYLEAADEVDSTSRMLIENQLIPQQEQHIDLLDRMIDGATMQ